LKKWRKDLSKICRKECVVKKERLKERDEFSKQEQEKNVRGGGYTGGIYSQEMASIPTHPIFDSA
jgi:hypothetical protein